MKQVQGKAVNVRDLLSVCGLPLIVTKIEELSDYRVLYFEDGTEPSTRMKVGYNTFVTVERQERPNRTDYLQFLDDRHALDDEVNIEDNVRINQDEGGAWVQIEVYVRDEEVLAYKSSDKGVFEDIFKD